MVASEKAGLLVTGSADQTVRLWNLKTHELIVSMFFAGSRMDRLDAAGLLLFLRRGRQADRLAGQPGPRPGRPLRPRRPAEEISLEPGNGAPRHHPAQRQAGGQGDAAGRRQRVAEAVAAQAAGIRHPPRRRPEQGPRRLSSPSRSQAPGRPAPMSPASRSCRTAAMSATSPRARSDGDKHHRRGAGRGRRKHHPHHRHQRISAT